jgi:hypothetical protein
MYRKGDPTSTLSRHFASKHRITCKGRQRGAGTLDLYVRSATTNEQGELTRHSLQDAIVKLVARRALPYQFVEYPEVRKLLT